MLAIKKETDYALQFLKVLVAAKGKVVSLKDVSEKTGVSFLFLQKIARRLKMAKLVLAVQGVDGGYKINGNPKDISIVKVVEIIEGKCAVLNCLRAGKEGKCCKINKKCSIKKRFENVNKKILTMLNEIKLSEI